MSKALDIHRQYKGKITVNSLFEDINQESLSLLYSPGVSQPCLEIEQDSSKLYDYTLKARTVAVISDGSAVLGLGNIGPDASLPVMEGKALLFKTFADVDAFPLCLKTQDVEEFISTVKLLTTSFGGINLEDISAPRCFEIEERLINELDIPVFHDDQHGTAIVVTAGLINSLKLTKRCFEDLNIVMFGIGAAGASICKMLHHLGVKSINIYAKEGVLNEKNLDKFDNYVIELVNQGVIQLANCDLKEDLFINKNCFIGVSAANLVSPDMISKMQSEAIIYALANPNPEILPDDAKKAGALIVATGRSDFPNQVNNVLAFPGLFKAVLDLRIKNITLDIKIASAYAIADCINEDELNPDYIIPSPFDKSVVDKIYQTIKKTVDNL